MFPALLLCLCLGASAEVGIPPLTARVTDLTGTLTREQTAALEQKLQAFEAAKGSQIGVLMVPTTQSEDIAQYSIRVVEQWKLGRKGTDDGVLLIVAKDDRRVRIEVGYGLEGVLTDAISNRIINEDIVPRFQQADFYGGVTAGVE
ncbi:MAG: TPM domain-containing protein, partial [Pandoraea sp.]|nr:TPM domain-containing protein [Pandoraea sp.]